MSAQFYKTLLSFDFTFTLCRILKPQNLHPTTFTLSPPHNRCAGFTRHLAEGKAFGDAGFNLDMWGRKTKAKAKKSKPKKVAPRPNCLKVQVVAARNLPSKGGKMDPKVNLADITIRYASA